MSNTECCGQFALTDPVMRLLPKVDGQKPILVCQIVTIHNPIDNPMH
jgi:hypothetical protein